MDHQLTNNEVVVRLSKPEALVLFEWLATLDSHKPLSFEHSSEERVLWKIEGQLESKLHEPFGPNYAEILAEARSIVDSGKSDS
jgi:hypothetical protein